MYPSPLAHEVNLDCQHDRIYIRVEIIVSGHISESVSQKAYLRYKDAS